MGIPRTRGWAVDAALFGEEPFGLKLERKPWVIEYESPIDADEKTAAAEDAARVQARGPQHRPAAPLGFVGRSDQLGIIDTAWNSGDERVLALIGFGGEGKTSIASRWVESLTASVAEQGTQVFWWTFAAQDVGGFLEAAAGFVGADPQRIRLPIQRANRIAAAAQTQRYAFVLDGLELLQSHQRDRYGVLLSQELAYFLQLFAREPTRSLCLLTTRAPVRDLESFGAYRAIEVGRLSVFDGAQLLRRLGVVGSEHEVRDLVDRVGGHALTLTLLGSYLQTRFHGRIVDVDEIAARAARGDHADTVRALLERYAQYLSPIERMVAPLLAAFRESITAAGIAAAIHELARIHDREDAVAAGTSVEEISTGLDLLVKRHVAIAEGSEDITPRYGLHPLIRDYFQNRLREDATSHQEVHTSLAHYWLSVGTEPTLPPTLKQLAPYIEATHHFCAAGDMDRAYQTYLNNIDQIGGERGVLAYQIGAYETDLAIALSFFPARDFSREPMLSDRADAEYLLRSVGLGLMTIGRLDVAFPICRRSYKLCVALEDWLSASKALQLLAELQIHRGRLSEAAGFAQQALDMASRVDPSADRNLEQACSLAYEAWTWHLRGDIQRATELFGEATEAQALAEPDVAVLTSLWGIYHADHLRLAGKHEAAAALLRTNLRVRGEELPEIISQCHRVLGDIELAKYGPAAVGAEAHYGEAVRVARTISHRAVYLEALIGRGTLAAERSDLAAAQLDLFEALDLSKEGGYSLYEADTHAALARAYAVADETALARAEARLAYGQSDGMNYRWGADAAQKLLTDTE